MATSFAPGEGMIDKIVFTRLTYGMYIVTSKKVDRINGQMSNSVFQATSEPPNISVSINKENTTHEYIQESELFNVSVLTVSTPLTLVSTFGFKHGRDINKFQSVKYREGSNGVPIILEHVNGYIEAKVAGSVDVGTHTIFIGRVTETGILSEEESMTYNYYHKELRGVTPKAAPTYVRRMLLKR
jgi:flavin reductase (DIM6/NTAB) family NADH-FMN oxidoreductase RutF